MTPTSRRLGDTLRALRIARGLTQVDLAFRIGTTQRRISALESGRETPTIAALERILDELGATMRIESKAA